MKTNALLLLILFFAGHSWAQSHHPPRPGHSQKPMHWNHPQHDSHDDWADEPTYGSERIQLALILDTSGSMDGLLDQAKSQLWEMVNGLMYAYDEAAAPYLEIALYEYGKSRLGSRSGYIRQIVPFTQELDWISQSLFRLRTDGKREFAGLAIERAVEELHWDPSRHSLRLIYIAGNESFDQGPVDYRRAIRKASRNGISVNTIFCGDHRKGISYRWEDAARLGRGTYTSIQQAIAVHDRAPRRARNHRLHQLDHQLNATYLPFGSKGAKKRERQLSADRNAATYGHHHIIERTKAKASPAYRNGSWDLVDAIAEGSINLAHIPNRDLPAEMQGMSLHQKQQYVREKQRDRKRIKQEIRRQLTNSPKTPRERPGRLSSQETLSQAIVKSAKEKRKSLQPRPLKTTPGERQVRPRPSRSKRPSVGTYRRYP